VIYDLFARDAMPVIELIAAMNSLGREDISKPVKESVDARGRRRARGRMEIEIAVDAMRLAAHVDQMILFSGNGDFRPLIKAVQRQGVRVCVVSSVCTHPPMIADELRRQADTFIDLIELKTVIGRAL
jgi:uncharacterized LabA/DUF88 family protein